MKISVFFTKKKPTYNPQGVIKINKKSRSVGGGLCDSRLNKPKTYIQTQTNYPKNILEFSKDGNHKHPTQKPVALMEYLIKTYTNEDEMVLDFTMGSGSTGVACINTNCNFIGIEMDEGYFEIARKRIYCDLW